MTVLALAAFPFKAPVKVAAVTVDAFKFPSTNMAPATCRRAAGAMVPMPTLPVTFSMFVTNLVALLVAASYNVEMLVAGGGAC